MANQTVYLLERLRIKKQVGIEINSNLHVLSAFMDIHIVFPNSDHSCPQQIWKTSDSWQPQVTKETIFSVRPVGKVLLVVAGWKWSYTVLHR